MVGARYLFFGTEAVVEEASGAMAPRFEGHVHLRSYASLVGFLLMPHLVTNNHAWAPQVDISVGGVHRRVGGVLASLNSWHADMYACIRARP